METSASSLSKKSPRRRRRRAGFVSRLTKLIFLSNLVGLLVLIIGALSTSRFSESLIEAKVEDLTVQTSILTTLIGRQASGFQTLSSLDVTAARQLLAQIDPPEHWRVRLYDKSGELVADSARLSETIRVTELEPIGGSKTQTPYFFKARDRMNAAVQDRMDTLPWRVKERERLRQNVQSDVRLAFLGQTSRGARYDAQDKLVVTVTMPIRRVQSVLGAVVLESRDVERILQAERRALLPLLALAFLAAIVSSLALTLFIARPIRRLARAAEFVLRSGRKGDAIPDLSRRRDEIGDLSVVMRDMTAGLYERVDDIANFAADVAHEIKNPLTSLRSASDTLRSAKTDQQREKLVDIIQNDVARMDRLISDISKASKVDANLARETAQTLDLRLILDAMEEFYAHTSAPNSVRVVFERPSPDNAYYIRAFETPFAQVLRNLIDNAITFSPEGGTIWLKLSGQKETSGRETAWITVEDEGPGIPTDNLETIFDRFYTQRPKGAQFGSHSGLGLAICRQIIRAHRGRIWAENRAPRNSARDSSRDSPRDSLKTTGPNPEAVGGAKFTLVLPRQTVKDGG